MSQIRAWSEMAEMASLPLLPLLGLPQPSLAWPKPSPGLTQDLGLFKPICLREFEQRGVSIFKTQFDLRELENGTQTSSPNLKFPK